MKLIKEAKSEWLKYMHAKFHHGRKSAFQKRGTKTYVEKDHPPVFEEHFSDRAEFWHAYTTVANSTFD